MLSTPIMHRSPFSSAGSLDESIDTHSYLSGTEWAVPTTELENLLRFAEKLDLDDGEITPVQAWYLITQHEKFGQLEETDMERLRDALLPLMKCSG